MISRRTTTKRRAAKRQTSVSAADAGIKSARSTFLKILEKADPDAPELKRQRKAR